MLNQKRDETNQTPFAIPIGWKSPKPRLQPATAADRAKWQYQPFRKSPLRLPASAGVAPQLASPGELLPLSATAGSMWGEPSSRLVCFAMGDFHALACIDKGGDAQEHHIDPTSPPRSSHSLPARSPASVGREVFSASRPSEVGRGASRLSEEGKGLDRTHSDDEASFYGGAFAATPQRDDPPRDYQSDYSRGKYSDSGGLFSDFSQELDSYCRARVSDFPGGLHSGDFSRTPTSQSRARGSEGSGYGRRRWVNREAARLFACDKNPSDMRARQTQGAHTSSLHSQARTRGGMTSVQAHGEHRCGTSSFRSEAQHMGHTSPLDPQAEQKGSTSSFLSQVQHGGGYSPFHSKAEYKGGTPSLNPQRQQPGAAPPLPSQLQGEMVGEFPTPANHVPTPDTPWLEHAVAEFAPPPHYLEPSPSVDVEAAFMRELDRLGSGGVLPAPSPRPPPERASQEVVSTASLSSLGARLDRVQAQLNELKLGNPAPATSASPAEATPADEAAVAQQVSSQLRAELKLEICEELRSALIDEIKGAVTADLAAQLKQMQTSLFAALRPSSRPPRNGSPEAACGVDASSVSQARGCCSPVYERESALSSSPDESANEARTSPPRSRGQQPPRGSGGVATGEGDRDFLLMEQMAEQATSPGPLRKPLPTSPASCFVAGPSELRPKPQANAAAAKPRPALRSATCRAPLADGSTSRSSEPSECAGVTPPLPSDVWAWARPPTPGGVARGGVAAAAHARTMEGRPGVRATPRRAATQSSEARAKNVASQEQLARRHVQGDHQYRERQRAPPADAKGVDPARAASISGQTCAKSTRACLGSRRASTGGLDGPQESSAKSNRKDHFTSASCAR